MKWYELSGGLDRRGDEVIARMLNLELKPEVEEQLELLAKQAGLSVEDYLKKKVEEMISASEPGPAKTPRERVRLWREFLNSHADVRVPPLSDEAISRESIYSEREDRQL